MPEQSEGLMRFLRRLSEALHIKPPDPPNGLLDYLRRVTDAKGQHLSFTYDWWRQPRVTIVACMLLGLIAVGGVWPTIVNLIAFHSLFRPKDKEEKVSLWNVKPSPSGAKASTVDTSRGMDQLKAFERDLEEKLRADEASSPPAQAAAAPAVEAPVRELTARTSEVVQTQDAGDDDKVFDRKEGDFYPVERHTKPKDGE